MYNKIFKELKALEPKKRNVAIGSVVIIILVLVFLVAQLAAPQRSVASYCKVYKEEKIRLAKLPGNTWPSGVFNEQLSDASEFATSFGRLEKVAPKEIQPDVSTLKSVYQNIHDNPSQAISASLSAAPAEDSLKVWTDLQCKN